MDITQAQELVFDNPEEFFRNIRQGVSDNGRFFMVGKPVEVFQLFVEMRHAYRRETIKEFLDKATVGSMDQVRQSAFAATTHMFPVYTSVAEGPGMAFQAGVYYVSLYMDQEDLRASISVGIHGKYSEDM